MLSLTTKLNAKVTKHTAQHNILLKCHFQNKTAQKQFLISNMKVTTVPCQNQNHKIIAKIYKKANIILKTKP